MYTAVPQIISGLLHKTVPQNEFRAQSVFVFLMTAYKLYIDVSLREIEPKEAWDKTQLG